MHAKEILLKPIKESTEDFEAIEREIKALFKREIYFPLLAELQATKKTLSNAIDSAVIDAIQSGRLTFKAGRFSGKLNAEISKGLRSLGARFDRKSGTYRIGFGDLPYAMRVSIKASESRFEEKIAGIDRKLAQILPEEIAAKLKTEKFFDRTLWKVESEFQKSVKGISIAPKLTKEQASRIAREWSGNMQLWITDFTKQEIVELRQEMQKTVFAGDRYESAIKTIQKSYGVSANKAKFLARQETSLLMTKFKQTRYEDAGVKEYKWGCVAGSKNHPVRPSHKVLEGKTFRWDDPPNTAEAGQPKRLNNPGQDYNCRCFARPIVRFK